jgi:hypothetical protein
VHGIPEPSSFLLGHDRRIERELASCGDGLARLCKEKVKVVRLTGNKTQIQKVVKLPKKAISRPNPGSTMATTTHAAVTAARAMIRSTVFRFSDFTYSSGASSLIG